MGRLTVSPKTSDTQMTYEKAMRRIEEISSEMENRDLPIDDSAKLFEEAVKLISFCSNKLKEVEVRITKINEEKDF